MGMEIRIIGIKFRGTYRYCEIIGVAGGEWTIGY